MSVSTASAPPASPAPAVGDMARTLDGPMTWEEVCAHPALQDLPFKIELDRYGRILMSPPATAHARRQYRIARLLDDALGGTPATECPVATSEGVRVPDAVWMSDAFVAAHGEEKVYSVAPEICVEVMSPSNVWAEMEEKVTLYLARGAREVWICEADGAIRVFGHEGELDASRLAPGAPKRVEL